MQQQQPPHQDSQQINAEPLSKKLRAEGILLKPPDIPVPHC